MALGRSVRALLEVHALTAFNSGLRSAGITVAAIAVAVLVLMWSVFAVMLAGLAFVGGVALSGSVAEGRGGTAGLVFTGFVVLGPFLSLVGGDGQELDWERFRPYPVSPTALFVAELIAMVGHPIMALLALAQLVFAAGLITGAPDRWPVIAATALACVLTQGALRLAVAGFVARLLRRFKVLAFLTLLLIPLGFVAAVQQVVARRASANPVELVELREQLSALVRAGEAAAASLPASLMLALPDALARREWLGVVMGSLGPVLLVVLLSVLAVKSVLADPSSRATRSKAAPQRLWTFRSQAWGVARLQLHALFDSQIGRFSLGVPFLWVLPIFVAARLAPELPTHFVGLGAWIFVPTALAGFLFNQFGLDRGAVKGLFLLPIPDLTVIRGKAYGFALIQLGQLAAVSLAAGVLLRPPAYVMVAGPLTAGFVFLVLLTIGQWTSTIWPRVIPRRSLRQAQGGFLFALVSLIALSGTMLPVSLVWLLLASSDPWLIPVVVLAADVLAFAVQVRFSREAARMLALRRERIVESVG